MSAKEMIKKDIPIYLLLALPFILTAYFWNQLPEMIPMHWNMEGQVDNFSPKMPSIFFIPLLNIGLYIIFLLIPRIDPKKKNYILFSRAYQLLKISINAVIFLLFGFILLYSLGVKIDIMYAVVSTTLILFIIIGNMMGNFRPNYFVGIRVPWTLNNEEVWRRTHRMAGKIWVWGSVIMLVNLLVLPASWIKIVYWTMIGVIVLVPTLYSWKISNDIEKRKQREI